MKNCMILALVGCSSTTAPTPASTPTPPPERATIDALATKEIADHHTVGVTVAVARGEQLVVAAGYGFADAKKKIPASIDTVYRIGSITKQFTAVAILQLIEQKKLALTDDVRTYVPEFPAAITIEQLLTHTSGIPDYTTNDWVIAGQRPLTHAQVLARFATKPLEFTPGSKWSYSNANYYLLGMVIEKVTGETYGDAVKTRVLQPAGMTHSGPCDSPQLAHGYAHAVGEIDAIPFDNGPPFAAGALCSTALDLVTWQRALEHGKVITPASLEKMRTEKLLADGSPSGYGYGVFISDLAGHHRIEHAGGINGFVSELARYPADDLTIVVLANTETHAPSQLEARIARVMLGLPEPDKKDLPLSGSERTKLVGSFELQGMAKGMRGKIFVDGETLQIQLMNQPPVRMLYQGDGTFALDMEDPVTIEFSADRSTFTLHQRGIAIDAIRTN